MRWATEALPRKGWPAVLGWLVATAIVVAAIFLDHEWKARNKDAGISLALVVVLLLLVALVPRGTRRLLRNLKVFKLAGVELEFQAQSHQLQAIADLAQRDGDVDHEVEDGPPRILDTFAPSRAGASLALLRSRLDERLSWIYQHVPGTGSRPNTDRAAVAKLRTLALLPDDASQNLDVLLTLDDATVDDLRERRPEDLQRFLRRTDQLVHQLRLVVLDTKVRSICEQEGFRLMDWGPQPKGRWPDFLAHRVEGDNVRTWWISVRMAELPKSRLFKNTTLRLGRREKRREVPAGPDVRALIVLPSSSRSINDDGPVTLKDQPAVSAVRLPALKRTLAT